MGKLDISTLISARTSRYFTFSYPFSMVSKPSVNQFPKVQFQMLEYTILTYHQVQSDGGKYLFHQIFGN